MIKSYLKHFLTFKVGTLIQLKFVTFAYLILFPYNELYACSLIKTVENRQQVETENPVFIDYKPTPYLAAIGLSKGKHCGDSGAFQIYLESQPTEFSDDAYLVFNVENGDYPKYLESVFSGAVVQKRGRERENNHGLGSYKAYFRDFLNPDGLYEPISVTLTIKVITSTGLESSSSDPFTLVSDSSGDFQIFRLAKHQEIPGSRTELMQAATEIATVILENRLPESEYKNVMPKTFKLKDEHIDQMKLARNNVFILNKELLQLAKKYIGINEYHNYPWVSTQHSKNITN